MSAYAIGLDFGTESVRAVLVDTASGEIAATAVERYPDGVIDERLPGGARNLPPEWALQNPRDWLLGTERTIRAVISDARVTPDQVVGIGVDFTACTVLPCDAQGTPLCMVDGWQDRPHAWPKLWKHHAAQPDADRINALAAERGEPWLPRYGGRISPEWMLPKALQILREAPDVFERMAVFVEGGDWIVWQLTGTATRNACAAGYKGLWHKADGHPSDAFLEQLDPRLAGFYARRVIGRVEPPGAPVGHLTQQWAERLGLSPRTAVAAAIIDAHSAVLGGGVSGPGPLFLIMGTSTCHLLMAEREALVPGMAGVVEDGIVPGFYGYEAGQAAVGDLLAWYVAHGAPAGYHDEAQRSGRSVHDVLSERAAALPCGATGLVALDWWNGNRCTLMDSELNGLLVGATLATRPEHVYRALIEATAFGTRVIVDAFAGHGLPVERLVAGGGLTRNPFLMQVYADVCGRELAVAGAPQASALGAAMLGAVAAGAERGGHANLHDAVRHMAPAPERIYKPVAASSVVYDELYRCYLELYDHFGRSTDLMKRLRRIRDTALSGQ